MRITLFEAHILQDYFEPQIDDDGGGGNIPKASRTHKTDNQAVCSRTYGIFVVWLCSRLWTNEWRPIKINGTAIAMNMKRTTSVRLLPSLSHTHPSHPQLETATERCFDLYLAVRVTEIKRVHRRQVDLRVWVWVCVCV